MGKIVKYCAACDESFAEKFAFCPNCGQAMTAFEMNPLAAAETKISDAPAANVGNDETFETENTSDVPVTAPVVAEAPQYIEISPIAEAPLFSGVNQTPASFDDAVVEDVATTDDIAPETKTFAATAGTNGNDDSGYNQTNSDDFQSNFSNREKPVTDGYRITVIEEKNVNQRNGLLLGTMILMVSIVLGATVFSLFNRDLLIGAIDQDSPLYVSVIEDVPMEIEEQPKIKNDDDGGGGGGGGKNNPQEATKGRLPNQVDKPIMPPQPLPQVTNASLPNPNETQGTIKRARTNEPVGLPNGLQSDNLSSGRGTGGGIGNGNGTGIGGGTGTGEGNGNGSGSGNGNGNGNGNGSGMRPPPPPPEPKPVGPTEAIKILSKPQPRYTDAARQNSVQGTVTLRVSFTANGQIGSIAPVSGLPYGLTEQAMAAARQIRFEPPKKNGVPYGVSKTIAYTFTIY